MDFNMWLDEIKLLSKHRKTTISRTAAKGKMLTFPSCNQEEKLIAI